MPSKYINITYPFKDSPQGFFLNLNATDADSIKSDIMHLILTQKGERLYNPEFGTNLLRYVFSPNDGIEQSQIEEEITTVIGKYLPNVKINKMQFIDSPDNDHLLTVKVFYSISDDVFSMQDIVTINI